MTEWIDVNDRLPDMFGSYLVTVTENTISEKDRSIVITLWFNTKQKTWGDYNDCCDFSPQEDYFGKVIAWQPLPEPYEAKHD